MLAERLKFLRSRKSISQADLAQVLKVAQQTVASWEKGKSSPNYDILLKIADYFHVTTDELLGRKILASTVEVQPSNTAISDEELHELFLRAQSELPADKRKLFIKMAKAALEDTSEPSKNAANISDAEVTRFLTHLKGIPDFGGTFSEKVQILPPDFLTPIIASAAQNSPNVKNELEKEIEQFKNLLKEYIMLVSSRSDYSRFTVSKPDGQKTNEASSV